MLKALTFLKDSAQAGMLSWNAQSQAAAQFGLRYHEVEALALENGIFPARYQRNRNMISIEEQLKLFRSRVAVIGCGGLGGYVIEELARIGVGHIVAIDPDVFEEHNLNRQILSTPATLGKAKVDAAVDRVAEINPAVTVTPVQDYFCLANGFEQLAGSLVAIDALDSISYRLELAEFCTLAGIPMVHGAIGGWYGHVATQLPGDTTVQSIYRHWVAGKGIEQQLGNPAFTPAVVASLEVAEACKILLGKGELLRDRKLSIDLLEMEFHEISYPKVPSVELVVAA
ncbi:Tungsten-containing aldehyde:ferredoxin oxidoreductase cofactor synthesis adenylyltransferase [Citrifermentans bremense]|uniref:Tungsten-containing aldehyde:ferredoxin oxidoreductase cofactor synthesis adenylyltransferase n=1 Tax=Citrifermentans bremense TaxID=60035 RepID=A0A6S6M122_9BACT|nr:HesA/MoeB/ThiF family protein [Citrifermentans bremense]BCG48027.1 Tungsten-containing aldehyde:ferredoxin oxidoreductase cofactor synthesis adenylyltransferase [Citrifermentans bremense]